MENMKGYESYQQICYLISYFVVYTAPRLCSCFLMRSAEIKLTRAEYSGALITRLWPEFSLFLLFVRGQLLLPPDEWALTNAGQN